MTIKSNVANTELAAADLTAFEFNALYGMLCIPWSTTRSLMALLGLSAPRCTDMDAACERLLEHDLAQCAHVAATHARLFAPTDPGVLFAAQHLGLDPGKLRNHLQLSRTRFWQLRAARAPIDRLASVVERFAAEEHKRDPDCRVIWQFMARRLIGDAPVHLRVALKRDRFVKTLYVLADWDAAERPDRTSPVLDELAQAVHSAQGRFPPVVLLTFTEARVAPLLQLAHRAGIGPWTFASTSLIRAAEVSLRNCDLHWLSYDTRFEQPYDAFGLAPHEFQRSQFALPDPLDLRIPRGVPERVRYSLHMDDGWQSLAEQLEPLSGNARRVMRLLARYPAVEVSAVAGLGGLTPAQVDAAFETLAATDLATRYDDLLALTPLGTRAYAVHEGVEVEGVHQRYEQFLSQRLPVRAHTKATVAFVEAIRQQAAELNRSALLTTLGDGGRIRLNAYRDEMMCRTVTPIQSDLLQVGKSFFGYGQPTTPHASGEWAPDGYIEVSVGNARTCAWFEISGTEQSTSKSDVAKWTTKLDAFLGYYRSGLWQVLYPAFPQLLIIFAVNDDDTYADRLDLVQDVLGQLTAEDWYHEFKHEVFATTQHLLKQHGPLAKIWHDLRTPYFKFHPSDLDDQCFAFAGLAELGLETELGQVGGGSLT